MADYEQQHERAPGRQREDSALEVADERPAGQVSTAVVPRQRRRLKIPLLLFVITCFSTFWAGATDWYPADVMLQCVGIAPGTGVLPYSLSVDFMPARRAVVAHWQDGLIYMLCVLAILFTHEMGHFLATLIYRIPASLPYFLPLPISPIGTLGAVIGMDGMRADRKEVFDIGLAGPLAGLVVVVPILWIGIEQMDLTETQAGVFAVDLPIAARMLLDWMDVPGYGPDTLIWNTDLNPYFMAAWVGLLVTGLNMLPVSQLDGGHVVYAMFRKRAHWIARGFMLLAMAYIVFAGQWNLLLMFALVMLIGTDHPPTRDDSVRIGWFRYALGIASMLIPLFCLAPRLIIPG